MNAKKVWLLYDGRYRTNEDDAICFEYCETLEEAKENADDYGTNTVIVEAEEIDNKIVNSKIIN